ncbi:hypothetical protein BC835DRAFT_1348940 [Cytidiella melzeri]|nr:hypothetical protein BC835DRAFT_1348940 [Cytidiella melzeri]
MSKELGTLVVVVLKARNLPDDHFFKQDVYTKVTLQGVTKKTGVDVKGGQHPQWDEEIRLNVNELSSTTAKMLEIACWSKEPRQDAMIGKGELDISDTLRTGEFDDWVPLKTDKGQRGEIYLEMTWFAAGPPPPLSRRPSKLKPSERLSRPSHTLQPTLAPIPSSPPTTTSRLTSPETSRSGRNSPLPPLPEDSHIPPPEALPSILRPGAGRPKPTQTSPQARPSGVQGSAQHHQRTSSAHDQLGSSFPELLRAGPPNGRTQSQAVDADVPSLSTASLGHSSPPRNLSPPGSFYPQPTLNGHIAPTQQSGYQPIASQQPSYSSHTSPAQRPTSYIAPAPQQPFNHHASPPLQPTYGNQQTSAPQPPSHGPQQTHQPPINPHHDSQPAMYPSQTPAPNPIPGFVIPLWGNQQPQPPPPTGNNAAPSYPGFGYPSPPLHAQARPQSYFAPPPASRPYPYNSSR